MEDTQIGVDLFGAPVYDPKRSMADYFGVPPFSILNTVDGVWQKRKKRWDNLIQDSGQMRQNVLSKSETSILNKIGGTSILDAVLAELMVKWFTEEGFKTLDPFAGDTVFGFVSGSLGRPFIGIELRQEQAAFNQQRCNAELLPCKYICDTSENMDYHIPDNSVDFVFSCPPYADLEVYSNLPNDLSNMPQDKFFAVLAQVLQNTYNKLKRNRFAVIVVGDVRGKNGGYIGLPPFVINAMRAAGYLFYNEIVLVNSAGTLPLRAGKTMNSGRKVGKRHQNVLVFYKGDPKEIKNNFQEIIPKNKHYEG